MQGAFYQFEEVRRYLKAEDVSLVSCSETKNSHSNQIPPEPSISQIHNVVFRGRLFT